MNMSSLMVELAQGVETASGASGVHRRGESRATALAALRAAVRGELHQASALIAEVERGSSRPGDAFDRMLAHLARATLLGIDGQTPSARAELSLALRIAAANGLDTQLVTDLVRGLGDVVVVTGPERRRLSSSSAITWPLDAVVIDARSHEVTTRVDVRSLKRRSVVRGLLYALARHPACVLDKAALAEAAWGCPYDPQRHDDALKANMLRLRGLLAGSGLMIGCGNPGYRLDALAPFVFVVPFDLLGGPWHIDRSAAGPDPGLGQSQRAGAYPDVLRMLDDLHAAAMTDDLGVIRARTEVPTLQKGHSLQELCTVVERGAIIDGIRHEIRIGARRISLRARLVSRQLLYAFAAAPSQYLSRNAIARVLWGIDYDPLRHECTLKSNIRRLRLLLAGFAELSSEIGGYRIVLPDGVELIAPVITGQLPPGS
jgi:DNA-binding response OmpR family regulator